MRPDRTAQLTSHRAQPEAARRPSATRLRVPSSLAIALLLGACGPREAPPPPPDVTSTSTASLVQSTDTAGAASSAASAPSGDPSPGAAPVPRKERVTLLAAGDACFGRLLGQQILKEPSFNPFVSSARLFDQADVRFVNMESQLSDQKGETQSPTQKLVFTGPPGGANALKAGRVDIVSAANNHMWDYGRNAFFETLDNLDRAGVKYAGAGRTREQAYAPVVLDAAGHKIAFVAFTGIWNQGDLRFHEAKDHVARAERESVALGVKAARATFGVEFVVVSYHGGEEYVSAPLQLAIDLHHAAIDAGADAVLGHHPHVTQGIEIYKGKPIFYSLGNYLMRIHGTHLETETGFFARIAFSTGAPPDVAVCPFRIAGVVPNPVLLADDPRRDLYERMFRQRIRVVQGAIVSPANIGSTDADGCAKVSSR